MEDGACIQCGLDNPGNQICEWRGEPPLHIDGTPVRKTSGMNSRRNLFKTVPLQFVCNAEGENGFYRPEFELYQIIATDSYTVSPGQTVRVSTNIVVKQSLGHPVGFFLLLWTNTLGIGFTNNVHQSSIWKKVLCHQITRVCFLLACWINLLILLQSDKGQASGACISTDICNPSLVDDNCSIVIPRINIEYLHILF